MCIDNNKYHFCLNRSSMIYMNSGPGFLRPSPRLYWNLSWHISCSLAYQTMLYFSFQVSIQLCPPNISPGKAFHSANTRMSLVNLVYDFCSKLWWYYNSRAQLIFPLCVWTHLLLDFPLWPPLKNKLAHLG